MVKFDAFDIFENLSEPGAFTSGYLIAFWVLQVTLLTLFLFFIYKFLFKKEKKKDAFLIFENKIKSLLKNHEKEPSKQTYFKIISSLKEFLKEKAEIMILDKTDQEAIKVLEKEPLISSETLKKLKIIFTNAFDCRFANKNISLTVIKEDLNNLKKISKKINQKVEILEKNKS